MDSVPVVSLADHSSADDAARKDLLGTLRSAFCELGFVRVEAHGVDPQLVRRVYAGFERFFALDESRKRACGGAAGGQRGFTPFGVEHAKDQPLPDLKEFFHVGPEPPGPGQPPNRWPAELPELRRDAVALFRALERCAVRLLAALEESFALPAGCLSGMVPGGNSILRALHYPPVPADGPPGSVRAAPHEDINLVTLLCEATDAGLEIRPPGARDWLPVEVPPGQILADSGDMLARITNEVVPATTHRVVNPPGAAERHRYALPFFAHPRPGCDLSVLPAFVGPERPARHPPITAGDFLAERLREIGLVS